MEGYLAGIEGILARGATGRETLSDFARFHFDHVSLRKEQYLLLLRDFPVHLTVEHFAGGSPQREKLDRITKLFSRILARGKKDGTLHLPFPVRETAEMLRGSFYGTTRLKMLDLIQAPFRVSPDDGIALARGARTFARHEEPAREAETSSAPGVISRPSSAAGDDASRDTGKAVD